MQQVRGDKAKLYIECCEPRAPKQMVYFWLTFSKDKHIRYIYQGTGMLLQSGYLFKNNFEIAARFARIAPQSEIQEFEDIRDNYALCFSKYLKGHRLKLQTDVTYETFTDALSKSINGRNIQWRFQIEMGL